MTDAPTPDQQSQEILRPAEVAERLGVSAATLRRWSGRFGDYLDLRDGAQESGSHRRYTVHDVETLGQVKARLEQGWTYEQVAEELSRGSDEAAQGAEAEASLDEPAPYSGAEALAGNSQLELARAGLGESTGNAERLPAEALPPAALFLRDAFQAVADTQQIILNSQQANRDMLGVMIQDNLNLKNENTGLRERMLELERELAELKRRQTDYRERMETRVRVLEDAVANLMANQQPAQARAGQPPPPSAQYASPSQPQPERRSFWSRLIGG